VPCYEPEDVARKFNRGADGSTDDTANWSGVAIALTIAFCGRRLGQCYSWPQRSRGHDTSDQLLTHV
jgi:hypothetical protein